MKRVARTVLASLALLSFVGSADAASSNDGAAPAMPAYEAAMSRGDVLLAAGDDEAAEREFRAALSLVPAGKSGGEARAEALHKLGIALAHQERYGEAEPVIAEAEKIARETVGAKNVLLADVLRAKTVVLYRTGRVELARAAFREAKAILEASADVWTTEADGETWRHTPSGRTFPAAEGPFKRLRRTMLDETGRNVVVHYRIGPGGWAATLVSLYVNVDRGVPLRAEFDATKTEIIRKYPNATVLSEGERSAGGLDGYAIALDLPPTDDGRVRRTEFVAFEAGNVMYRFRASYPAAEAKKRRDEVAALVEALLAR
jgi:tetratricopeptide (TPR) repeat protein